MSRTVPAVNARVGSTLGEWRMRVSGQTGWDAWTTICDVLHSGGLVSESATHWHGPGLEEQASESEKKGRNVDIGTEDARRGAKDHLGIHLLMLESECLVRHIVETLDNRTHAM